MRNSVYNTFNFKKVEIKKLSLRNPQEVSQNAYLKATYIGGQVKKIDSIINSAG